jgi:hypothetical protein
MEVRSEFYTWVDNPCRRDSSHFGRVLLPRPAEHVNPLVEAHGSGKAANVKVAGEIG